jgi:hypothetical protein
VNAGQAPATIIRATSEQMATLNRPVRGGRGMRRPKPSTTPRRRGAPVRFAERDRKAAQLCERLPPWAWKKIAKACGFKNADAARKAVTRFKKRHRT